MLENLCRHHDAHDDCSVVPLEAPHLHSDLRDIMLRFRLAPDNLKIGFMSLRSVTYPLSALLSIISVFAFLTFGLNYGIDFAGGTLMEMRAKQGQAAASSPARSSTVTWPRW